MQITLRWHKGGRDENGLGNPGSCCLAFGTSSISNYNISHGLMGKQLVVWDYQHAAVIHDVCRDCPAQEPLSKQPELQSKRLCTEFQCCFNLLHFVASFMWRQQPSVKYGCFFQITGYLQARSQACHALCPDLWLVFVYVFAIPFFFSCKNGIWQI